jgi:hypothetical protein
MIFDKKNFSGTHRLSITTTLHKAQSETNFSVNVSHTNVEVFRATQFLELSIYRVPETQKECAQYVSSWICLSSVLERRGDIYLDGSIRQRPETENCFV